jgi:hypothetical protein
MSDSLYECAIPKYLELVSLSEKPDVLKIKPTWFLESWISDKNKEATIAKICYDIQNTRNHAELIMDLKVYPQGFLSLSMPTPPEATYGYMGTGKILEIFFCNFDEFLNHKVIDVYVEELADAVLERLSEYEEVREIMIKKIEELEKFSFVSERKVITEKAYDTDGEKKLINGLFHQEDEDSYYYILNEEDYQSICISKPGVTRMIPQTPSAVRINF